MYQDRSVRALTESWSPGLWAQVRLPHCITLGKVLSVLAPVRLGVVCNGGWGDGEHHFQGHSMLDSTDQPTLPVLSPCPIHTNVSESENALPNRKGLWL